MTARASCGLSLCVLLVAGCDGGGTEREATLSAIRADIFDPRCSASVCHSNGGARDLDLKNSPHAGLVGVASVADPTILRVQPGEPDNSLLFQVVQRDVPDAELGTLGKMPYGGSGLGEEELDQLRRWIEAGANDD